MAKMIMLRRQNEPLPEAIVYYLLEIEQKHL